MLIYKVYSLTGKNRNVDYLAKIKNIQKGLKDGDEYRSTMLAYAGFFGGVIGVGVSGAGRMERTLRARRG